MDLEVRNLTKRFGGLTAVNNVDLSLPQGKILGVIGPNGAGKTTLFNCVASAFPVTSGTISFGGHDITHWPAYRVCRLGIARTFQVVQIFRQMTVLDNVMVGAFTRHISRGLARRKAEEVLEVAGLYEKRNHLGSELTIADLKRLEICRALATEPKLLLLDEVMAGLNPVEVAEGVALVRKLKRGGLTILMIEHIMEALMPVADHVIVLDAGKKIAEGSPEEIVHNDTVIKAYLGEGYHARSKGA